MSMVTQLPPVLILVLVVATAGIFIWEYVSTRARNAPKRRDQMTWAEKAADYGESVKALDQAGLPSDSEIWQRMTADPGIKIESAGGNCPVQIHLEVDGHSAYFRARGTHWSFEVAKPEYFAPCNDDCTIFRIERVFGKSAGWMSMAEAAALLEQAIGEFRSWKGEAAMS